ncbi:MAG: Ig-like domain-containing protein [Candidatus Bathyarchaeota archaeon]|nr:Ig-like domain-containing protein [Candidatus Bathyarchaeota archaeon]
MRKDTVFVAFLAMLLVAGVGATVYAKPAVSVYVMNPTNPSTSAQGTLLGTHWVGEIPVKLTSGAETVTTVSYCMNPEKVIEAGSTYAAVLAAVEDTAAWRAVSYVLSWNYPTDDTSAAVDQTAIWRLLNRGFTPAWLQGTAIDNAGKELAELAHGKDVVRKTDQFTWISPIAGNMSNVQAVPGETVTFAAQLTTQTGAPRANVRVDFTATLNMLQLNSTYLSPATAHTNSQGIAQVTLTVPADAAMGSTIEVKASTHSIWPQQYVNLKDPAKQDLIGISENFELTTSCNLCVLASVLVVPEYTLGALGALAASAAAFIIGTKIKKVNAKN